MMICFSSLFSSARLFASDGRSWTYVGLDAEANAVAASLSSLGIGKGGNCCETPAISTAVHADGRSASVFGGGGFGRPVEAG